MVKKKKDVQNAEQPESEPSKPEETISAIPVEQQTVPMEAPKEQQKATAPSIMDILQSTNPQMLQTADQLGLPIKPLLEWAIGMEAQVKAQSEALETLGVKLTPLINLAEKAQQMQARTQVNPNVAAPAPEGGVGLGSIMQFIAPLLSGGGGGMDELTQSFMKEMIASGLENARLGTALLRGMVTKYFPDMMPRAEAKS